VKNNPFFINFKKILAYPFNWEFIRLQQKSIDLLDKICNSYLAEIRIKFSDEATEAYQYNVKIRNGINKCWNLHDIKMLLSKEITTILWRQNKINMQIFDFKTNWFLWKNIFLRVDLIPNEAAVANAKSKLNILREISSTLDLGK